jgi:hypothetical protein
MAVAAGPAGDEFHYINETWSSTSGAAAPSGSCYVIWCIPFFDGGPSGGGYYFLQ